jgi:hypothetical protein
MPKRYGYMPYLPDNGDRGLLRTYYLVTQAENEDERDRYNTYVRERCDWEWREFNKKVLYRLAAVIGSCFIIFGLIALNILRPTMWELVTAVIFGLIGIILTWLMCLETSTGRTKALIYGAANSEWEILFLESEVLRLEADVASLENRIADSEK